MKNNRTQGTLDRTLFSELSPPYYSHEEAEDLHNKYSERNDIAKIADKIVRLLIQMQRFLLETELDEHAPKFTPGTHRGAQYRLFQKEGGNALVNNEALITLNSTAKTLGEAIEYQKST